MLILFSICFIMTNLRKDLYHISLYFHYLFICNLNLRTSPQSTTCVCWCFLKLQLRLETSLALSVGKKGKWTNSKISICICSQNHCIRTKLGYTKVMPNETCILLNSSAKWKKIDNNFIYFCLGELLSYPCSLQFTCQNKLKC